MFAGPLQAQLSLKSGKTGRETNIHTAITRNFSADNTQCTVVLFTANQNKHVESLLSAKPSQV